MKNLKSEIIKLTYHELIELRNNNKLIPYNNYLITDYFCTVNSDEFYKSIAKNHQFDIMIQATSKNTLSENAKAFHHNGDNYFKNSKLEFWKLKYCLDNDINRFGWADEKNGKGVIYYMKDEFNNECGYDFKNIMFKRYKTSEDDYSNIFESELPEFKNYYNYFYTFSFINEDFEIIDLSLNNCNVPKNSKNKNQLYYVCKNNIIKEFIEDNEKLQLNNIIFETRSSWLKNNVGEILDNFFNMSCSCITIKNESVFNYFDYRSKYITIKNNCIYNKFGYYSSYINIDNELKHSIFGPDSHDINILNTCSHINIGMNCSHINIGMNCSHININDFSKNITIYDKCNYINIGMNCFDINIYNGNKDICIKSQCYDIDLLPNSNIINIKGYSSNIKIDECCNVVTILEYVKNICINKNCEFIQFCSNISNIELLNNCSIITILNNSKNIKVGENSSNIYINVGCSDLNLEKNMKDFIINPKICDETNILNENFEQLNERFNVLKDTEIKYTDEGVETKYTDTEKNKQKNNSNLFYKP